MRGALAIVTVVGIPDLLPATGLPPYLVAEVPGKIS
jgi:hypothetical protein